MSSFFLKDFPSILHAPFDHSLAFAPTCSTRRPGDSVGIYIGTQDGLVLRMDTAKETINSKRPVVSFEDTVLKMRSQAVLYTEEHGGPFRHRVYPDDFPPGGLSDERGLLGIAFDPVDPNTLYVMLSTPTDRPEYDHYNELVRVRDGVVQSVLRMPWTQFNHNGGHLEFGPTDGMLYISTGDGGGKGDEHGVLTNPGEPDSHFGNAQDLTSLKGKLLRIDVRSTTVYGEHKCAPPEGLPYGIPPDNPFALVQADEERPTAWMYFSGPRAPGKFPEEYCFLRPEIYAYGLRNPWKFNINVNDPEEIFIADVGQNTREEVNLLTAPAQDFGWNALEGTLVFNKYTYQVLTLPPDYMGGENAPMVPPVLEYSRSEGVAVIGGFALQEGTSFALTVRTYLENQVIDQPRCIDLRNVVDCMFIFGDYIGPPKGDGAPVWVGYHSKVIHINPSDSTYEELDESTGRWDKTLLTSLPEGRRLHTFSCDGSGNIYAHWKEGKTSGVSKLVGKIELNDAVPFLGEKEEKEDASLEKPKETSPLVFL